MKKLLILAFMVPFLLRADSGNEQKIRDRITYLQHVQCKHPQERTEYNQGVINGLYEALIIMYFERVDSQNAN